MTWQTMTRRGKKEKKKEAVTRKKEEIKSVPRKNVWKTIQITKKYIILNQKRKRHAIVQAK